MSTAAQQDFAQVSWQTPRNARTLRAFMTLQRGAAAARIAQLRRDRGNPPQEVVASKLGVSHRAVQAWESGETRPSYRNLEKLADFYGVTPEYLLLGQEDGEKPNPLLLSEQIETMADEFRGYVAELKAALETNAAKLNALVAVLLEPSALTEFEAAVRDAEALGARDGARGASESAPGASRDQTASG